ncbi:MAG: RelA/SpoT family protein [Patescibacteria group bacterium]
MDIKEIVNILKPLSESDANLVSKAFNFAKEAHHGQKRKTNEPYFVHSFEAALKVAQWRLDAQSVAAALLHDVAEDTKYNIEDIKKEFNEEIAFLVDGVTKLGRLKYRGVQEKAENLRKMILAISQDIRVVIIKLADRLHNMQTLSAVAAAKQKRIALETEEIYAPLAYRLGMQMVAGELEDLSFPYIHPQEYRWLINNIKEKHEERRQYAEKIKPIIEKALKDGDIKPIKIDSRAKRWSSLYKKLLRCDMNINQVYDVVALRVIVKTIEDCYAVLGIIHHLWPPLPGKIKDYIALPKPNGYRSLHTVVFCVDDRPTEFQIRTAEMHEEAENGIAAYWAYHQAKTGKDYVEGKPIFAKEKDLAWVQQLKNWQKEHPDSEDFISSLKVDFFKDRIFVITPKGEVADLPAGATPVDFAYQIHSDIGDQCVGAKVNNKITALNHQLHSGDVVEILTQKNKKPSESWLDFVKTSVAKRRIRLMVKDKPLGFFKKEPNQTEFRILVEDRVGLLKDISSVFSRARVNITKTAANFNEKNRGRFPIIRVRCEINNKEKTEKLILKLKEIKGVREISCKLV